MKTELNVTVNGIEYTLLADGHRTLLDVLRNDLTLLGTKSACEMGECGACTVLLNGNPVNACLVLAHETDGCEVLTIEGLSDGGELHAIQKAFIEEGAIQCGFCTPGMIVASKGLLDLNPFADANCIQQSLLGNLCRCTGYTKIMKAIQTAQLRMNEGKEK